LLKKSPKNFEQKFAKNRLRKIAYKRVSHLAKANLDA